MPQAGTDRANHSANSVFGLLKSLSLFAKPDRKEWEDTLRSAGLDPWRGHDNMWRLEAPDGEVRAEGSFRPEATTLLVLYFPAQRAVLSDATLSWMFRTAADYSFEDGDGVELLFPEEPIAGGSGQRRQSFVVCLTSGALARTVVTIKWKQSH
jgi:hypothetical protein